MDRFGIERDGFDSANSEGEFLARQVAYEIE